MNTNGYLHKIVESILKWYLLTYLHYYCIIIITILLFIVITYRNLLFQPFHHHLENDKIVVPETFFLTYHNSNISNYRQTLANQTVINLWRRYHWCIITTLAIIAAESTFDQPPALFVYLWRGHHYCIQTTLARSIHCIQKVAAKILTLDGQPVYYIINGITVRWTYMQYVTESLKSQIILVFGICHFAPQLRSANLKLTLIC